MRDIATIARTTVAMKYVGVYTRDVVSVTADSACDAALPLFDDSAAEEWAFEATLSDSTRAAAEKTLEWSGTGVALSRLSRLPELPVALLPGRANECAMMVMESHAVTARVIVTVIAWHAACTPRVTATCRPLPVACGTTISNYGTICLPSQ